MVLNRPDTSLWYHSAHRHINRQSKKQPCQRRPVRGRTKHNKKAAMSETSRSRAHQTQQESSLLWRLPVRGRTQRNEKAAAPGRCLGRIVLLPRHLAVGRLLLYLSVTLVCPRRSPPAGCFCIVCYLGAPASITPGRLLLSYLSTLCARGRKPGREAY